MKLVGAAMLTLLANAAFASRILLVPLDNRPASGQFAQMIGAISGTEVQMPPYQMLGNFTKPGDPEAILTWLNSQRLDDVSAVVISADMIAYGGLIASRVNKVTKEDAIQRLRHLEKYALKVRPRSRLYVFSSVIRLAPTATKSNRGWRTELGRYVGYRDELHRTGDKQIATRLVNLSKLVPPIEIKRYYETRERNHAVQQELVRMASRTLDYLVIGQDDAQQFGPHIPETKRLKEMVTSMSIGGKVYFCEGVDQNSNVLVSRAMLKAAEWMPRVRVVYSDPYGRKKIGAYESKSIQETVQDQLLASGARLATRGSPYDYTLFVNTPHRRETPFQAFMDELTTEIDSGSPVCLADINLGKDGTCDKALFQAIRADGRLMKMLAFSGWNTPGNTLGTAIPTANMTLLAAKQGADPVRRELAQKAFLLHRIVDDVLYHQHTRPLAYRLIDQMSGAREETYGNSYAAVDEFVRRDMRKRLEAAFSEQLRGFRFETPQGPFEVSDLQNVRVFLPWPRAYEVRLEFGLRAKPLATAAGVGGLSTGAISRG